eukprot:gene14504-21714_t
MGVLYKAHKATTVTKEHIINDWMKTEGIPQLVGNLANSESLVHK